MKVNLMGLEISTDSSQKILDDLVRRAANKQKTFVVTPYSEFFYYAAKDYKFKDIINSADYSLPDGISIQWLDYYIKSPLTAKSYYGKVAQAFAQEVSSLFKILIDKEKRTAVFKERISGADFYWKITEAASQHGQSIFLLGGFGETTKIAVQKTLAKFPDLKISYSNANPGEDKAINDVNDFKPDYLLVAYGPLKQEYWIKENLKNIQATVAIGLGGTFDYVAGTKQRAPKFFRDSGLEWAHRLFTQPYRLKRIWHATVSLCLGALRYKVFDSLDYRQNAVGVIINNEGKVFLASRNRSHDMRFSQKKESESHWQFPQGGIEKRESAEQGLLREMREELGTSKFEILGECSQTYSYEWNHYFRKLIGNTREFKGQLQHIFYMKFTGNDSDFKLDIRELDSFAWIDPANLISIIHPMRREMLQVVLSDLPKFLNK